MIELKNEKQPLVESLSNYLKTGKLPMLFDGKEYKSPLEIKTLIEGLSQEVRSEIMGEVRDELEPPHSFSYSQINLINSLKNGSCLNNICAGASLGAVAGIAGLYCFPRLTQ